MYYSVCLFFRLQLKKVVTWCPDIPVNLWVSVDRTEVTCSAGGECGVCGARGGNIILEAEGTDVILHSVRLL